MPIARVENGQVVEQRPIDLSEVPEHKRAPWRPVVIEGSGEVSETIVEPTQVRIVKSPRPLADIKAELRARVDVNAENVRLRFITPGTGMAMTYQEKHAQARAVLNLGQIAANALTEAERNDQFPTLAASVGIEAATLYGCAELVVSRYEAFADLSNVIERQRLLGKKNIGDASDAAAAQAAYEAITWPNP